MKIAKVISSYPPYPGGMGNVAAEMADRLAKKHEIHIFTPSYQDIETGQNQGKNITTNRLSPSFSLEKLPLVDNSAILFNIQNKLANKFDIVHLHYPFFGTDLLVSNWRKKASTPLVITYHMDPIARGLKEVIFKIYKKLLQKQVLFQADKIIASSFDYIKNSSLRDFFESNQAKFVELPFGVDTKKFKSKQINQQDVTLSIRERSNKLLFVGGMDKPHYFKGVPLLLEALSQIKGKIDLNLFLIGSGELQKKYKKKVRQLKIEDRVQFLGYVGDSKLIDWYNFADLTVLPSVNKAEAFGLVLLESMACNTPVLASDLAGVREVAQEGGFTFETNNKKDLARKILNFFETDQSNQLKKPPREVVEKKFSWEKRVNKLEQVYHSLLN